MNGLRLGLTFFLLLIPTFAMGATLPVLMRSLCQRGYDFGPQLSGLYACNTLGAVLGVLGAEYIFMNLAGLWGAALIAAGLNFTSAFLAWRLYSSLSKKPIETRAQVVSNEPLNFRSMRILLAAFCAGFSLLALEVIWFRLTLLITFGNSTAFAVMLAVVLAGIGLGGLATTKLERVLNIANPVVLVALLSGTMVIESFRYFPWEYHQDPFWPSFVLMFPVSFLSGMLFPMLGRELFNELKSDYRSSGYLALANTIGATLGSFCAGFLLLTQLGMEYSLLLFSVLYGVLAIVIFKRTAKTTSRLDSILPWFVIAMYGLSLSHFPLNHLKSNVYRLIGTRYSKTKVVAYKEGLTETILYLQTNKFNRPLYYRMQTNSHSMSSTRYNGRQYMSMYVNLPVAIHPNPKKALLICFGVGTTAKALTDTKSFEEIDVVDISRSVIDLSYIPHPDPQTHPLNDKRVKVHIEDGRFFLQSTQKKYDLITGEPPPPKGGGVTNLYSKEYFQLVHDRLASGGMISYWLPIYQLTVSDFDAIVKAFVDVFDESSLWMGKGSEWMLLGIREPKSISREHFSKQWRDPIVKKNLINLGFESPEQMGSFFLADGKKLREILKDKKALVDNYPHRLNPKFQDIESCEAHYAYLVNAKSGAKDFAESSHIKKIWPQSLIEDSLPSFRFRELYHDTDTPFKVLKKFDARQWLHTVLTESRLEQPVLWILGTNIDEVQICQSLGATEQTAVLLRLGAYQLSKRRFKEASNLFEKMYKLEKRSEIAQFLWVYSLASNKQRLKASDVLKSLPQKSKDLFVDFFVKSFKLNVINRKK
ncbi:MAG: fused MFS/spermidine synthase [Planctomycetota bacterium]|nr:fused MFS/spermidine synthase [Planctomycetota bacterium]